MPIPLRLFSASANPGGLRVATDGALYAPNPAPYNGLQTGEQRRRTVATEGRQVRDPDTNQINSEVPQIRAATAFA